MKTGVVDVGGGLRGVYAAGILDSCLENGIRFDLCVGVSAGSANAASYLAGQQGRNYAFYTEYLLRARSMSFLNFLFRRSYLDLDYVYGTLSNAGGENPLDCAALRNNPAELVVVACNALTGRVQYFYKEDMAPNDYSILKASSAIPFVCHPYEVDGVPYYDGALGDPVPVEKAFQMGCDKVVLILSRPRGVFRASGQDARFADRIGRKYPLAAENLRLRAERYRAGVALAEEYEAQGSVLILAPEDTFGVDTLTRKKASLKRLYQQGREDASAIRKFL